MKVLFLSQRVPYPPNRGDKITTWRLVERLSRDHKVIVIAFAHDEADAEAARELDRLGIETVAIRHREGRKKAMSLPLLFSSKPLTLGVYGSRLLQERVDERIEDCDLAYAYSSSMGRFLLPHRTPWVMHFAELDSDKWRQYADVKRFPMNHVYRREWRTLLAYERTLADGAHTSVFCTPIEQAIFDEQIPGHDSVVMRNGVDLDHYRPEPDAAEPGHLVFTGVMDYYPNVDGCVHFVAEVLPLVRESHPDVRFTIVGARPNRQVLKLAEDPAVMVTGFVDDTRDYLRRASVAVAPLRIARGIQNKVLEALAMGLPLVGTTSATQGVEGEPGKHFLLADDAVEQASAIRELLGDRDRARALGAAGRAFVEENNDWDSCLAPLDDIVANCTTQPT